MLQSWPQTSLSSIGVLTTSREGNGGRDNEELNGGQREGLQLVPSVPIQEFEQDQSTGEGVGDLGAGGDHSNWVQPSAPCRAGIVVTLSPCTSSLQVKNHTESYYKKTKTISL